MPVIKGIRTGVAGSPKDMRRNKMRKLFLVFLVLLAAAALGFAQDAAGTVTWAGEARIGAEADFSKEDPTVYANDDRYGQVTFSYDKGAFNGEVYARGIYNDVMCNTPQDFLKKY
jgi:hypothetical protein